MRAQLVIAFILGTTVLSVLLYLWRRPSAAEREAHDAPPSPSASSAVRTPSIVRTPVVPKPPPPVPKVKIGDVQHLACGASPKLLAAEANLCDSLPFFEQALVKTIDEKSDCAPKGKEEGSINYVMTVDFRSRSVHIYPGRSGSWRGKQAKGAAVCVKKSFPKPAWDTMIHQYRWYRLAVLATYPKQPTGDGLPNFQ